MPTDKKKKRGASCFIWVFYSLPHCHVTFRTRVWRANTTFLHHKVKRSSQHPNQDLLSAVSSFLRPPPTGSLTLTETLNLLMQPDAPENVLHAPKPATSGTGGARAGLRLQLAVYLETQDKDHFSITDRVTTPASFTETAHVLHTHRSPWQQHHYSEKGTKYIIK